MEGWRAVRIALLCVSFSSVNTVAGADVEMRVRRGDSVSLHCDRVLPIGFYIAWFKNCSHENQPPLVIHAMKLVQGEHSHYDPVWSASTQTHGLLIKNFTRSDEGLYYCAIYAKAVTTECGLSSKNVYQFGNRTTRLSLEDSTVPCANPSDTSSTSPVSDCSVCWKLLVSVCPVCVLLSSVVSSTCVFYICRRRTKVKPAADEEKCSTGRRPRGDKVVEDQVCYASLDLPIGGPKRMKKKTRAENSEVCTYSQIQYAAQN